MFKTNDELYAQTSQFEIKCLKSNNNENNTSHCKILDNNGFDESQGWMYFYPVGFPIRGYQFKAVTTALFKNTLLCLPTGLGKTFVGAVVMLNFYRWFPKKKVIFIAPTRPLVAQQMEACWNIVGIRYSDTAELTGSILSEKRASIYEKCRVLFMTPQVLQNDISKGLCRPQDIICLVVDEAHKATGKHSYCEVIRSIVNIHKSFRILALSASPGGSLPAIQNLIDNLFINELVYYSEDHPETREYSHERNIVPVVLEFTGQIKELVDKFSKKVEDLLIELNRQGAISSPKIISWGAYRLRVCLNNFKEKKSKFDDSVYRSIISKFYLTISFFSAYERLISHGVLAFCRSLLSDESDQGFYSKCVPVELKKDNAFYEEITNILAELESALANKRPSMFPTHPKIIALENILVQHFSNNSESNSRVIVFSQYRDSVEEIVSILSLQSPLLKVMHFVGQSLKKSSKGQTQKEQLEALRKFREGDYNVLVSTSVGEEGLDIGEVDLIICFDNSSSPLRLIQRIGRTGRKRTGKVFALLMKGKEENSFADTGKKSNLIEKILTNKASSLKYTETNRIIPHHIKPFCVKIKINTIKSQKDMKSKKESTKPPKDITSDCQLPQNFSILFSKPISNISTFCHLGAIDIAHSLKSTTLHKIIYRSPSFNITSNNLDTSDINKSTTAFEPFRMNNRDSLLFAMDSDIDEILNEALESTEIVNSKAELPEITNIPEVIKTPEKSYSHLLKSVIIESDEDFINLPVQNFTPPSFHELQQKTDNNENSDIIMKRTKRKQLIDSDDSPHFVQNIDGDFTPPTILQKDSPAIKKHKKNEKPKLSRQFLLTQAAVSGDDSVDSVHSSGDNKYVVDSFIDDKDDETPKKSNIPTPWDTLYKQSLLSPSIRKIPFKTPPKLFSDDKDNWLKTALQQIEEKVINNAYDTTLIDEDSTDSEEVLVSPTSDIDPSSDLYIENPTIDPIEKDHSQNNPSQNDSEMLLKNNSTNIFHNRQLSKSSDELVTFSAPPLIEDLNMFTIGIDLPQSTSIQQNPLHESKDLSLHRNITILCDSKSTIYSQIPSLLRNKYKFELLTLQHMHFPYMLGHNIGLDIIKSSELVKEYTFKQTFKNYRKYQNIYDKIIILIQHDEKDEIDITTERIKTIHSIFKICSFDKIGIFFTNSQESSAALINQFVCSYEDKTSLNFSIPSLNTAKLIKRASNLSSLNIISPSVAMELLIEAKSIKNLIKHSTPQYLMKCSSHITNYQAQLLHKMFHHYIIIPKDSL